MKKLITVIGLLVVVGVILWACNTPKKGNVLNQGPVSQNILPGDCLDSCIVTADSFDKWFVSGKASVHGTVMPANSITFSHENNCAFYRWSEQMFLWLTSPLKVGGTVLESSEFYDVSPAENNTRTLTRHAPGVPLRMTSHIEQTGPNRLPIVIDKSGRLLEIEKTEPIANKHLSVKNGAGSVVKIAKVKTNDKGVLVFFDPSGKVIDHPKAILKHKNQPGFVQKFTDGKKTVFLDANGPVQTESGQDTGDVLMSQNGSLVYYLTMVNDMYAYYLKAVAVHAPGIDSAHFPTDANTKDSIIKFAKTHGDTSIIDGNALAIEIKTSWVRASTVPDPENYFTVKATIPNYDTTNARLWIHKGDTTVLMALVGMHVVGSVDHHAEMIWSTFEHQSNTPNASYDYLNTKGQKTTTPGDTSGRWKFNANANPSSPADTQLNISHMVDTIHQEEAKVVVDRIIARPPFTISASNTQRVFAWGSPKGQAPNAEDISSAEANSKIISINLMVQNSHLGNDLRKNYLFIGSTWTDNGTPPNGHSYSKKFSQPGSAVGTSVVANSTMETYIQLDGKSCLYCHRDHSTPT